MASYYEETILEPEESRATLRTPEYQITDTASCNDNDFDFFDHIESLVCPPFMPVIDQSAQPSDDSDKIPFDRTEWYITESHSGRKRPPGQYEFLRLLIQNPRYRSYVSWVDESEGLFTILLPDEVAALWKKVKSRQTSGDMDYDSFSRGVRYHYKTGLMIKTNKKYTFRFKR